MAWNAKVVAIVMALALLMGNTATVEGSWGDGNGGFGFGGDTGGETGGDTLTAAGGTGGGGGGRGEL